jgi:hypothetical protein
MSLHFRQRAWERFGIKIGKKGEQSIITDIISGRGDMLYRINDEDGEREAWRIDLQCGKPAIVIYNVVEDELVTIWAG